MQAAASKIQEAQSAEAQARQDADSAQAVAESRDAEAASLRRGLAELQGALSGQEELEVGFLGMPSLGALHKDVVFLD